MTVPVSPSWMKVELLPGTRTRSPTAAYHLIALRGLRRGEAAGLRWCDLDFDGKTAMICQQLQQYDGRLAICSPKTPHSTRVIALDHTTVAALRAHWDRQQREAAAYGPRYKVSGFVFTNLNGDPMAPDRLTRTFRTLTSEAGLPPIRLHDLRHGAAEKVAMLIIRAGCLVPGTRRRRRKQSTRGRRRSGSRPGQGRVRRSRAHPARQIGRPRHRRRVR